ncbi:Imm50 family immunity protein [Streptomyces sp. CC208A]|uniref:Imm50 family immunity protein n=1 Tax=Streptomyces sp. CC208A TaxID=3044573 RepID=UPI0024A86700|nr:Imm50 family immunity protein [Streptomyces sp. CC208A]
MPLNWVDLLVDPRDLQALYGALPPSGPLVVRSVHLSRYGPALTLRADLPTFPPHPLPEWEEAGFDRIQCHLQFLAVERLEMRGWASSATTDLRIEESGVRRIRVTAESSSFALSFEASDDVLIGHLSAFSVGSDERDSGPRGFFRKVDSRRFDTLPDLSEKTFYERL